MLLRPISFAPLGVAVLLAFATLVSHAGQLRNSPAPIVITGLGKGAVPLIGPWQFHPGDDLSWAVPAFDDSGWERIGADRTWGDQGHARLTGFAWYRTHLELTPAPGLEPQFSLLVPHVYDAYEVYWNGKLIARNGTLQPYPVWYATLPPQIVPLEHAQRAILALRVWKAPLLSDDSGHYGGFASAPWIGSPEAIETAKAALDYTWLRGQQLLFGENLVYTLISVLSFLAWCRRRSRWILFWVTGFTLVQPVLVLLLNARLALPYGLAMGASQPISSIQDISLWFLLLWLLHLRENQALARLTRILAVACLANKTLDGVLVGISWNPHWIGVVSPLDAVSAFVDTVLEAFPLVLAAFAFSQRKRLDFARWLIAMLAFLDEMIVVLEHAVKQGRQFTDWPIALKIDRPLFTVAGSGVSLFMLVGALLLASIVYVVYHSLREDQRKQDSLEREKVELLHTQEQMRHYAEHDGLTGLLNHRIIMDRLRGEIDRARRDQTPLTVVLADIDHFKHINDQYGHPAGDRVLQEIASIFMRTVRPYDWVGRYGGEEFLLVLPATGFEAACLRVEQLRQAVQSTEVLDGDTILQVTSSFGVASCHPSGQDAETIVKTVDGALYRAKDYGRNCVVAVEIGSPQNSTQDEPAISTRTPRDAQA